MRGNPFLIAFFRGSHAVLAEIPVLFVFVLHPFCEKVVDFLRKVGENERKVVRFFEETAEFSPLVVYVRRKGGDVCRFCTPIEEEFRGCECAVGTLGFEPKSVIRPE